MTTNQAIHIFGEVLFDHFPDGSRVLGGAPFNVAWHLQAFGQAPRFISRIGRDPSGHEITSLMEDWGMRRDSLQMDVDHPTGKVRVLIENGEPHYEIVADCAYDFIDENLLDATPSDGFLYHGSLSLRNPVSEQALQKFKSRHLGKIFIDVNLRPPWWNLESLLPALFSADWVKLNADELHCLCPDHPDIESAMRVFFTQFNLETLVVTRGAMGAIACHRDLQIVTVTPPERMPVVDTVGAGDAFAAVLLLGLNKQWPLALTLERAQLFASALVGKRGATVQQRAFYDSFNEQWH